MVKFNIFPIGHSSTTRLSSEMQNSHFRIDEPVMWNCPIYEYPWDSDTLDMAGNFQSIPTPEE